MKRIDQYTSEIRARSIIKHFINLISASDRIIDIGAGKGWVPKLLEQEHKLNITALDVVDHNTAGINLNIYNGTRLPYKEDTFDVCLLIFVLHHTDNPERLIKEALRVTRKKVIIIEDTPKNKFECYLQEKIDYYFNHRKFKDIHIAHNVMSEKDWLKLFNELKIKVIEKSTYKNGLFRADFYTHEVFVLKKFE